MAKGIVNWRSKKVVREVGKKVNRGLYPAAKIVEKHIERKFLQRTYGAGTGEMLAALKTKKSKYDGYIVGIFDTPKARWVDSLGARAIFFEYGRAAPRDARGKKVQPPRPFFRPGLYNARREIQRKLGLKVGTVKRFRGII